ncbi:MAG: 4Fe-4S binding protein [Candidatus Ozemobacteraceae bacterium]
MLGLLKNALTNLISKPATRAYPFERREPTPGSRGHLEIDAAVCIYCGACGKRCPTGALKIVRDPKSWTLEPGRCIICGYCVEVCPKKCLRLDPHHGLAPDCEPVKTIPPRP